MSNPIETNQTPGNEFQSHFGTSPGTRDAKEECKDWERLCEELIAERERLRTELAKAQFLNDEYVKTINHLLPRDYECPYTEEELLSFVGQEPPLSELIAELERDMRSGA